MRALHPTLDQTESLESLEGAFVECENFQSIKNRYVIIFPKYIATQVKVVPIFLYKLNVMISQTR